MIDPTSGHQTEINEYGPDGDRGRARGADGEGALPLQGRRDVRGLRARCRARCPRTSTRTWSASCAASTCSRRSTRPGRRCALGLPAEPNVVSPNQREAEAIVGHEFSDDEDLAAGAETLAEMGAESALIHYEDGCVARIRSAPGKPARTWRATLPRREVVSTVGSGDAFLAGFLSARYRTRVPRGLPGAGRGLRRGEHPALRRRRLRPRGRRGAVRQVRVEALESPSRDAETRVAWRPTRGVAFRHDSHAAADNLIVVDQPRTGG